MFINGLHIIKQWILNTKRSTNKSKYPHKNNKKLKQIESLEEKTNYYTSVNTKYYCIYSRTSIHWTPSGPEKSVHYKEVFTIERCISSKNLFFGLFKSVHNQEVFIIGSCSLIEVLLYQVFILIMVREKNFSSLVEDRIIDSIHQV
jgi:hypothetical protein